MSQYFELGGQTLWNPSNGVARMFLRQVAVFETELGLPSGIGEMRDDECQIDPAAYAAFVDSLLARHVRTTHAVLIALSEGFVTTVLVLAERAGIEPGRPDGGAAGVREEMARLREASRALGESMAR
ncbi:DUF6086 family protein [Streptacidiphilus rugosus]|uniref:DUF6086 family protein n=1 Tax=Streptacidiphilus rugosus TaxID=405783 RepID=UPI0005643347|nr:DUF6086 family protein [Streptacidiphilus rugosus]